MTESLIVDPERLNSAGTILRLAAEGITSPLPTMQIPRDRSEPAVN